MERPGLFTPIRIGTLELPNRIMMSPAFSNSATPEGEVSDYTVKHYVARARSGVGLIMVEHTSVSSLYIHPGRRLRVSDDRYIPGLARLARAVHEAGCKIGLQLAHSIHGAGLKPEDLTREQVAGIVADFVQGARRAREAGFDAIELHCAHTYTLADFLSRRTNKRWDEYGGDVYGRMRLVREIVLGIREILGRDFPFLARISADEFIVSGNTLRQSRVIAQELEKLGVDGIDVSAGVRFDDTGSKGYSDIRGKPSIEYPDGPNVHLAEDIKKRVRVPVITVGKLGNPAFAESVIREGRADMVALIRPLLADPRWVEKVRQGRPELIKKCVYCTSCLWKRRREEDPVRCMERDCARCLTCLRICPYHVPVINEEGQLEFDRDWCDECGLCAGICPARVVRFQANPQYDWVADQVAPVVRKIAWAPRVLLITCSRGPFAEETPGRLVLNHVGGHVGVVRVPCVGKVETLWLLRSLELGLDGILLAGCQDPGECRYRPHHLWTSPRLARTQELLAEARLAKTVAYLGVAPEDTLALPVKVERWVEGLRRNGGRGKDG